MNRISRLAVPCLLAALAGCAGNPSPEPPAAGGTQAGNAFPTGGMRNQPYSPADVHFMSGMIAHHAQAVVMAGWAPSHGASDAIQRLCERIVVGQRDEIALMQDWLRERRLPVPDPLGDGGSGGMAGMDHGELMPGMLNASQMAELDASRGADFDRLFLRYMIMHHEGALSMVDVLFTSYGAAQDDVVFKFANDVFADQSTEIARMQLMLDQLSSGG